MRRRKTVLTVGEVADFCQVSARTVQKWFDSGILGGYVLPGGKDRRVPAEELMAFMDKHGMPVPKGLRELPAKYEQK